MSTTILSVSSVFDDGDEWLYPCPRCGKIRGVPKEGALANLRGEQYQDNLCGNWHELSMDCSIGIKTVDRLHVLSDAKVSEYALEAE